jgi:hypothetical protein
MNARACLWHLVVFGAITLQLVGDIRRRAAGPVPPSSISRQERPSSAAIMKPAAWSTRSLMPQNKAQRALITVGRLQLAPMSALKRITDSSRTPHHVRKVPNAEVGLLDHLVGNCEHFIWNDKAKRLGGLAVDDEIEFGWLLDRQIAGLRPT